MRAVWKNMVERETVYASGVVNRHTWKCNTLPDPVKKYKISIGGRGYTHTRNRAVWS